MKGSGGGEGIPKQRAGEREHLWRKRGRLCLAPRRPRQGHEVVQTDVVLVVDQRVHERERLELLVLGLGRTPEDKVHLRKRGVSTRAGQQRGRAGHTSGTSPPSLSSLQAWRIWSAVCPRCIFWSMVLLPDCPPTETTFVCEYARTSAMDGGVTVAQ